MPLIRICQGLFDQCTKERYGCCWQVFYRSTVSVAIARGKHI